MRRFTLSALTLALLLTGSPKSLARGGAGDAATSLEEVDTLYAAGDYDAASRRINDLLVRDTELSPDGRARVYLMKARLEMAFGRQNEIRLWLAKAHAVSPGLTLDPVRDPPTLITIWNDLKRHPGTHAEPTSPGRFFAGFLPLGLGHFQEDRPRDGALFLATESLFLLASATLPQDGTDDERERARILGGATLLGAYGYELVDMLPDLARREPDWTGGVHTLLSLFPFGAGQAKNGEPFKAFSLAAVQAAALATGTFAGDEAQRQAALAVFGVSWGYGILDALLNEADTTVASERGSAVRFAALPTAASGRLGVEALLVWQLP